VDQISNARYQYDLPRKDELLDLHPTILNRSLHVCVKKWTTVIMGCEHK